jgi:2-keto-4-pentenoate hydratase/2-oxohepta-3-ene-1,7-dioic acid hydratase in catechol pathway
MTKAPQIFARLRWQGEIHFALKENDAFRLITAAPYADWKTANTLVPAGQAQLLAPVVPSKIVAVGLNYRSHALEMGMALPEEPLLFLKPPTALADPAQDIVWPPASARVDFEGELALVIGKLAKNISPQNAMDHVLGFTLANDITARDLQKKDGQWTRAKGFDGFCPLGPVIVTTMDWDCFEFQTLVNGACVQAGRLSDLIFPLPEIVSFVSQVMTLLPGDVIITGTPPGIGALNAGDKVQVAAEQIGVLENRIIR